MKIKFIFAHIDSNQMWLSGKLPVVHMGTWVPFCQALLSLRP